jgi:hypothetical protein
LEFTNSECKLDVNYGSLGWGSIQQSWVDITSWIEYENKIIFLKRTNKSIEIVERKKEPKNIRKDSEKVILRNNVLSEEMTIDIVNKKCRGLIGIDENKNVYFRGNKEGKLVIFKYNKQGELIGMSDSLPEIYGKISIGLPLMKEYVLDIKGNIYYPIITQKGFKMLKITFSKRSQNTRIKSKKKTDNLPINKNTNNKKNGG